MISESTPSKIFVVKPKHFGYNTETSESNKFQKKLTASENKIISKKARKEFEKFIQKLKKNNIDVVVFEDKNKPVLTDSVFPNNWISFHEHYIILYPMLSKNRRKERRKDIVEKLNNNKKIIDISDYEKKGRYLEGTGSIVFDYRNKIAFACESDRTHKELFTKVCKLLNYKKILFNAVDKNNFPVYHTNVILAIGSSFVVFCTASVKNTAQKKKLTALFKKTGKEIISISQKQVENFAGNMYQVFSRKGESKIILSSRAYNSLTDKQKIQLAKHGKSVHSPLTVIEKAGGGSARCMLAEIR